MIVFVKVVLTAKIKARDINAINFVCGLMVYFSAECQLIGDFPLEEPAGKPVILVAEIVVLIDPVAAATISRPIAETLLDPNR